ncbi:MAG: molybdate ABC transporter substrate-binding protein [Flaviflexus sp.]|nr:molybdate ABC transporter substrate-binding protein [Flaviflexus sp.]
MRIKSVFALASAAMLALAGCSSNEESSTESPAANESQGEDAQDVEHRDLTVMIAASMCDVAEETAKELADTMTVRTVCSGSSDLVAQIKSGAEADILVTANQKTADDITNDNLGTQLDVLATNELVIVVPAGNPAGITGFDEGMNDHDLVICAEQVPCGDVSRQLAELNNIELKPVSEEQQVTDVLGKVTSGQADVGLVYRTDAASAGDAVEIMDIPQAAEVPNAYPLLVIDATEPDASEQVWIDAFTTGKGRERLIDAGFTLE